VHAVVRAHPDRLEVGRELDVLECAGEGLLVHVRMAEDTLGQYPTVLAQHLEPIGVVLPARVGVPDGRDDATHGLGVALGPRAQDERLVGQRRPGGDEGREECGREDRRPRLRGAQVPLPDRAAQDAGSTWRRSA